MNRDIQTYIDSFKKERAENTEQNTLHLENFAIIAVDSNIITPQKKQNGRKENHQEHCKIPFEENEENNSIITSKTIESNANEEIGLNKINKIEQIASKIVDATKKIEPNVRKTIEQIASNKIELIMSKIFDVSDTIEKNVSKKNKVGKEKYFLACIENIRAE